MIESSNAFAVSDRGDVTIQFPERMIVPDEWQNLGSREVAFDPRLGRRRLEERTETLLTDSGFVDFVIRPAI